MAAASEFEIVTSVLTVTEVAWLSDEATSGIPDDRVAGLLDALWATLPGLRLVDIDALIAREARDLMRSALPHGWRLKPNDAIHLATARRLGAEAVHTYDRTLWKYGELLGVPVHEPQHRG